MRGIGRRTRWCRRCTSRGSRSRVLIVTWSCSRLVSIIVPVIPFSIRFWPGIAILGGEDDLVAGGAGRRACRAAGPVCSELAGGCSAFLGHRVHLVALEVARVGQHHGTPVRQALAHLVPVLDHRLRCLRSGVVDVQPLVGLVLGERGAGLAVSDLLPRLALPLVVSAVDLCQLRCRDLPLELREQATGSDRADLRSVTDIHRLGVRAGAELGDLREPLAVAHRGLVHHHDRVRAEADAAALHAVDQLVGGMGTVELRLLLDPCARLPAIAIPMTSLPPAATPGRPPRSRRPCRSQHARPAHSRRLRR